MIKKILLISFYIILIWLLCGCVNSNNEKVVSNTEITIVKSAEGNSTHNDVKTVSSTNANESKSDECTTKISEGDESTNKDYSAIGFELVKKESLFVLNNALTGVDVIKLIGEPEGKSAAVIWGADGLEHQTWYYKEQGLEINFTKDNMNAQIVNSVRISNPSKLKTIRGIGIGSTQGELLKAYKNEINQEENRMDSGRIIAGTIYGGLIFKLENDKVALIFIGAAAE